MDDVPGLIETPRIEASDAEGMMRAEAPRRRKLPWAGIAVWAVSALAIAAAVAWVLHDRASRRASRFVEGTVPPGALKGILPVEVNVARLLPRPSLSEQQFQSGNPSPGFVSGWLQRWHSQQDSKTVTITAELYATPFEASQGLASAMKRWNVPWAAVFPTPAGDECYSPSMPGWSALIFLKANVIVSVWASGGDEKLARRVARLIDSKINRALVESQPEETD